MKQVFQWVMFGKCDNLLLQNIRNADLGIIQRIQPSSRAQQDRRHEAATWWSPERVPWKKWYVKIPWSYSNFFLIDLTIFNCAHICGSYMLVCGYKVLYTRQNQVCSCVCGVSFFGTKYLTMGQWTNFENCSIHTWS